MKNRFKIFTTILSSLACLGLLSIAQASDEGNVGGGNTVEGFHALNDALDTGTAAGAFNTALGWFSLGFNDVFSPAGLGNTGVGAGTLDIAGGSFGTAAGAGALLLNFTASDNTAVGFEALLNNDVTAATLAADNTAVGFQAMFSNNNGANNTAVGSGALFSSDVSLFGLANGNTAVGSGALTTNNDGAANTAVGAGALLANFDGNSSTAVGFDAGLFSLADETTAVGFAALGVGVNTGDHNTALGSFALFLNGAGDNNTATGHSALENNTLGDDNTAVGWQALRDENTGSNQTAMGSNALLLSNGLAGAFDNSAFGRGALESALGAARNTALGDLAGTTITSGSSNVLVGADIGFNLLAGNSNTYIGADVAGGADESNTVRIADNLSTALGVSKCFIGGIVSTVSPVALPVVHINTATNQLSVFLSSERFKKDIKPMNKASEAIFALKPVTYHLKDDTSGSPQFGLLAEDVAKVNPDLVSLDTDGKPLSVAYDAVNVMLLNEFLKEHKKVEAQQASISQLKSEMETMVAQLKEQAAQIQKVSAQLEVSKPAPQVVTNKP
jgi:trimeric autotransporter adhesin